MGGGQSFNPAQQAALDRARARVKGDGGKATEDAQFDYYMSREGAAEGASLPGTLSRTAIAMVPGAGVAGAMGYQPKYETPMSPLPSGIEKGPSLVEKINKEDKGFGDYADIALTTLGIVPDLGYTAAIRKIPLKDMSTLSMNAVGPPARAVGQAVKSAAQTLAEPFTSRTNPDAFIGRVLSKRAAQQSPGASPAEVLAKMMARDAELGPDAVLADTGESMGRLARNMTQGPGETAQRAKDVLGARQAAEKTRMISTLKENISPKAYYDVDAESELGLQAASPHFRAAFKANPSVASPVLNKLLETPAGRSAFEFARERIRNRMSRMATPDKELTEQYNDIVARGEAKPSKGGVASGLKLETHDLIRQDLYDQMQMMKKKVAMGNARRGEYDEIRDIYNQYRQELLDNDATAKAGPNSTKAGGGEYERGLERYKESARLQEALEEGRSFMRGDPETLEMGFEKLGAKEKDAYRAGVVKEAIEMIGRDTSDNTPAQIMAALKTESSVRKKLEAIAPSETQFNAILKEIERRLQFRETNRTARNVSQTGSIAMEEGQLAGDTLETLGGAATDVLRGRTEQAFARAMSWALGQLRRIQMPQETRDRIGKLLLSQDPADKEEAFILIRNAQGGAQTTLQGSAP